MSLTRYLKSSINGKAVYVKLPAFTVMIVLDTFLDGGYVVTASTEREWLDMIQYGRSYEVEDMLDAEEFKNNHLKYLKDKDET